MAPTILVLQSTEEADSPTANACAFTVSPEITKIPVNDHTPPVTVVVPIKALFANTLIVVPSASVEVPSIVVAASAIGVLIVGQSEFSQHKPALISSKVQGP